MNCPECNGEVPKGGRFCSFCGTPLRVCPGCDAVWKHDATFCGSCGHTLGKKADEDSDPITAVGIRLDIVDEIVDEVDAAGLPSDAVGFLYEPSQPDRRYNMCVGELTVGAGDKNDVVMARPAVSWNHALLLVRADRVRLQDSASTNGTYVNEMRIFRPQEVSHGDVIKFGNVEMKVWLRPNIRE